MHVALGMIDMFLSCVHRVVLTGNAERSVGKDKILMASLVQRLKRILKPSLSPIILVALADNISFEN